jgi:hypothetical protein
MTVAKRKPAALRVPRSLSRSWPSRRTATRLRVERLESRTLLAASPVPSSADLAHETLDSAVDFGHVHGGTQLLERGAIGNGPEGAADVEWFSFTLDQSAQLNSALGPREPGSSFRGVLSLFNNDLYDFGDPYNPDGHRLLKQVDAPAGGGVATLGQLLGPGTYYLAVSGHGNFFFHPLLAGSGLPGSTGAFDLRLSVTDAVLESASGPRILTCDPAALSSDPSVQASLDSSPLAIRFDLSGPLDPGTVNPDPTLPPTVRLIFSPTGNFDQDGQDIPFTFNVSTAIEDSPPPDGPDAAGTILHYQGTDELQLFPTTPLAPGHYEVLLAGQSVDGSPALADPDGNYLGADADHPDGQDYAFPFQVIGAEGNPAAGATAADTMATAQDLGNLTTQGVVQVAGVIGDDPPADPNNPDPLYNPANDVDLYHFRVAGTGQYALVAEVFAGRFGSPLDPGVSLFQLDPRDHRLHFVAGDDNTYDTAKTTDDFETPLRNDSVLYASLTAGQDYYVAVADGSNTPSPLEGQPPGTPGVYDPNIPNSAQNGLSTGPYVLNLLVQAAPDPPHVVATSPIAGETLTQVPTHLTVKFDEPMNLAQLAASTFQVVSQKTQSPIYIQGPDGYKYFPRFGSYDSTSNQATFLPLDGLANGEYQLHLSGPNGVQDLHGNALVGNDPSGDYVVRFTVDAAVGHDGRNPPRFSDQEPNDDLQHPQELGILFSNDLAAGVTITRDFRGNPAAAPKDAADVYEFQILLAGEYSFTLSGLSGSQPPKNVALQLYNSAGRSLFTRPLTALSTGLTPGIYRLKVSGWTQGANISYRVAFNLGSLNDNAPPLLSGPAPAIAIQLASAAPPTPPTTPTPVTPPPTVTPPPIVAPPPIVTPPVPDPSPVSPPSSGNEPSPVAAPVAAEIVIAIPALSLSGPVSYGVTSTTVARRFFDRALEANPDFLEARRYRAVLLARQGAWDQATRDINGCLDRQPRSGETLYAAACVAARAAEAAPSPRALNQAFDLLERAWSLGSGRRAHEDPDLAVLRRDPRFLHRMGTTLGVKLTR